MSSSKEYEQEIKLNFENFNQNNTNKISAQNLNDIIESINSKKKNPFIYNSIKLFSDLKQAENDLNISPEEYISFIDKQLNNDKNDKGLKNIFDIFCDDDNTNKISWNKFPLIAKELGNDDLANNLINVLKQSKLYSKELNFEKFIEIMNSDSEEDEEPDSKNKLNNMSDNIPYEEENLKINNYIENYEDKPTYKQRKLMKKNIKENDEDITSSSRSINKISDDIIIEEKSYENENEDEKVNKRYHRRYRSKKIMNNNNNNNINVNNKENNNIENTNHKSFNKYRKKHLYH